MATGIFDGLGAQLVDPRPVSTGVGLVVGHDQLDDLPPPRIVVELALEVVEDVLDERVRVDIGELHGGAPRAGVGEQVVDQRLHPLDAADGEADEPVGVLVELAVVAAGEQLDEPGDHPQRLLKVVRGDVRELLEVLV